MDILGAQCLVDLAMKSLGGRSRTMASEAARLRYSANLGFLWREQPLLQRIANAAKAGFDAIEFHDDAQAQDHVALREALDAAGLPVVGLNTAMGDSFGLAAVPGSEDAARRDIDAAIEVAERVGAGAIHVMAGKTDAPDATRCYIGNLQYALDNCGDLIVLIEPICREKIAGYFMHSLKQAAGVLAQVARPNLRIMFDCFHVRHETQDVLHAFIAHAGQVGHVQIASYPQRAEPDAGELDYRRLLPGLVAAGYSGFFGCEYHPATTVEEGLGWRESVAR